MVTENKRSFINTLGAFAAVALIVITLGAGCGGNTTPTSSSTRNSPSGSSSEKNNDEVMTGYKMYSNPAKGFSIQYPESWKMEEGFMSTDIIFNAPSKNGFSENLNVIAKNIPGASALSLSDLKSSLVEGYKTVINNFKLIDTKDATVDGRPALIITYTGSEGDLKGNFIQYFTIKGDDAYIITVTRPQDEATRSEKEFATMVKSFKITK